MIILVTVATAVANDLVHIFTQELDLHQLQDKQWGCSICYLFLVEEIMMKQILVNWIAPLQPCYLVAENQGAGYLVLLNTGVKM